MRAWGSLLATLLVVMLVWTNPTSTQLVWWDEAEGGWAAECDGGERLTNLQTTEVWFHPASGGGYRKVMVVPSYGKEGLPDSVEFNPTVAGHAYLISTNNVGSSCASNEVYVPGPIPVTSVEDNPPVSWSRPREEWFDVRGRRVSKPTASGVYFRRVGSRTSKVVILK